jgi:hypothetical protein
MRGWRFFGSRLWATSFRSSAIACISFQIDALEYFLDPGAVAVQAPVCLKLDLACRFKLAVVEHHPVSDAAVAARVQRTGPALRPLPTFTTFEASEPAMSMYAAS